MAELRWNPMLNDWVMIASHRQNRPQMPKEWCPFCPGSGRVPDDYDVLEYDNDFPALSQDLSCRNESAPGILRKSPAYGKCEVILYSPDHTATLPGLPPEHIRKLVDLWADRYAVLSKDRKIKYVFIFENRGEAVGVTMPHPHGQIYAYPYVPKKLEVEIDNSRRYHEINKRCMICDIIEAEADQGIRVLIENESFITVIPFFTEYPYGVFIYAKCHKSAITEFTGDEREDLADIIKKTTGMLDCLFDYPFPYMMCMHQSSVNTDDMSSEHFHFHIEFYTPMRSRDRIKFNASSETGAWAPCNPSLPEETAEELRAAYRRYLRGVI